ncbi:hypothetical protein E1B28_004963 [Marasmius oreades]|uniref:Uncharacterized protein n=1 Tax=Marasmius oreades TaxID=181124 RepID=A0A9P8ADC4_9AGAR|nr:uncharacterized protein E1B28_004963 [Marasmius oreades]KAG7097631.1 hypothetical protein E1B28_004963 [Marasmius oreades]
MAFVGTYGVSIEGGAHNYVQGSQTINYTTQVIQQEEEKRTVYDEFPEIRRGLIRRLRDFHREDLSMRWNYKLERSDVEFRVEKTISTAEIYGDSSRFTVVAYKGQDAEKAWKKDFQRFSEVTDSTNMQLFGINRSSVPLLLFHGELVPLSHFWERLGFFGRSYVTTLGWRMGCERSQMWMDPQQGTLIRGLEGPGHKPRHYGWLSFRPLQSTVEFLEDDVCLRHLSRRPLIKGFDLDVIAVLHLASVVKREIPPATNRPYVVSSLTSSPIAIGSGVWTDDDCYFDSGVVMPDGRTSRFNLTGREGSFSLRPDPCDDNCAWLSQAWSVYHELGVSSNQDLSQFKLIQPAIWLNGLIEESAVKRQRRLEGPPIYFFLHPFRLFTPLEPGSAVCIHTWSFDENGRTSIPHAYCHYLGLPTKLRVERITCYEHSYSTETYKYIREWQVARGFNPSTTDFTRYMGYPIYKVVPPEPVRFEELTTGGESLRI